MSTLYRPSNGTESIAFMDSWCCDCAKDVNADCPILAATMARNIDDADYPTEWRYSDNGRPECTAFEQTPHPDQAARDGGAG